MLLSFTLLEVLPFPTACTGHTTPTGRLLRPLVPAYMGRYPVKYEPECVVLACEGCACQPCLGLVPDNTLASLLLQSACEIPILVPQALCCLSHIVNHLRLYIIYDNNS